VCSLVYFACEDNVEKGSFISSNDLNISSYLEESVEYSQFVVLLKVSGSFLTRLILITHMVKALPYLFLTNEAIQNFISDSDFNSLEDLIADKEFLAILVEFHIVLSSYNSNDSLLVH